MKTVKAALISLNASFSHTALGIRCLTSWWNEKIPENIQSKASLIPMEFTINQNSGDILREICSHNPDLIIFSTYIWNASTVCKLLPDVKKLLPDCILGCGGPEFSYSWEKYMNSFPTLDFIIFGEGEITFSEILESIIKLREEKLSGTVPFESISGVIYRKKDKDLPENKKNTLLFSGKREPIKDLDLLPFPYPELSFGKGDFEHKILYYESSRGCPFSCAYCLSSAEKNVRLKSLGKVLEEISIFLDHKVPLVKFVDRTYNLNEDRYIKIWEYIVKNHNGKTKFHFEIEAEFLSENALDFLQTVPEGIMQFEIGIQSSNPKTLKAVFRSPETEKLKKNIQRIPKSIHTHLDLIAGLPFENLESFGKSFDFALALKPDALQLGFLKVLSGTKMEEIALKNGTKWMEEPVYECLSTPWLSFTDISFLKNIEILTDIFWNKGIFKRTAGYIFKKISPWSFFTALEKHAEKKDAFIQARKDDWWFSLIADFFETDEDIGKTHLNKHVLKDLLKYDFVSTGKKGNFPLWYNHRYSKEKHRLLLEENEMYDSSRSGFAFSEFEIFDYNPLADEPENSFGNWEILIEYENRSKHKKTFPRKNQNNQKA